MTGPELVPLSADDPDVMLINDFIDDLLSDDARVAVIARRVMDPDFAHKTDRLITLSKMRIPWKALEARYGPHASWPDEPDHKAATPIDRAPSFQRNRRMLRRVVLSIAAALVLLAYFPLHDGILYARATSEVRTLGHRDTQASNPAVGTFVSTSQNEQQRVDLSATSHVQLHGMSRLTYRARSTWPSGIVVTLKGEAVFEVSRADGNIFVGTMMGGAVLKPGIYAIRCELGCTAMRVTVGDRGRAYVNGASQLAWIWLDAGEHGEVRYPHDPQHTTGYQYPEVGK